MTRCLVMLVCALSFSPLRAMDANELMRHCSNWRIVLAVQTWSPEARPKQTPAKQPVFPDSVAEIFSQNYPNQDARIDAIIKALAPPLASQDFHIFRVGDVLWIAPQEAPPLFNASLHLEEAKSYSTDEFFEALAPSCDSTVPPARVLLNKNGARIRLRDSLTLSFDPGDWSLARALYRFAKVNRGIQGWLILCRPAEAGSSRKYYFEVQPVTPMLIRPPAEPPFPQWKPLPKIANKKSTSDLLLRFNDPPKY